MIENIPAHARISRSYAPNPFPTPSSWSGPQPVWLSVFFWFLRFSPPPTVFIGKCSFIDPEWGFECGQHCWGRERQPHPPISLSPGYSSWLWMVCAAWTRRGYKEIGLTPGPAQEGGHMYTGSDCSNLEVFDGQFRYFLVAMAARLWATGNVLSLG